MIVVTKRKSKKIKLALDSIAQTRDRTADLLLTRQAQLPLCYPGRAVDKRLMVLVAAK